MQGQLQEVCEHVQGRAIHLLCRQGTGDLDIFREVVATYRLGSLFQRFDPVAPLRVIDIGAHIGSFALLTALHFPAARVVAYEMLADNAELVRRNAERNGVAARIRVENVVVAERAGWWDPAQHSQVVNGNTGGASVALQPFAGHRDATRSIRVVPATSILDGSRVDLLKIDCEGSEYRILYSAADGLDAVGAVVGELHDAGFDTMVTNGYRWNRPDFLRCLQTRFLCTETFHRTVHAWGCSELFLAHH